MLFRDLYRQHCLLYACICEWGSGYLLKSPAFSHYTHPKMLCVLSGLTVAEHFRDAEGQDVLLFIDNIFRFTQVGSEPFFGAKNVTHYSSSLSKALLEQFCKTRDFTLACIFLSLHAFELRRALPLDRSRILLSTFCSCCP